MRAWAMVIFAAILMAPLASAQDDSFTLPAGSYRSFAFATTEGDRYELTLTSDVAVDLVLVPDSDMDYANATSAFQFLNQTHISAAGLFPSAGAWVLVVDNSDALPGGANGATNATVELRLVHRQVVLTPSPGAPNQPDAGVHNPWPVLMLTAPYWDLGFIGLGGMALWFLLLGALIGPTYKAGWDKLGVLAIGGALYILLWSFLPAPGPIAQIGLPMLLAVGLGWMATRATSDGRQALALAFLAGGLAALFGSLFGHLISSLWASNGALLVGHGGFDDPVFVVPIAAGASAFLIALIAAFVQATEDEEETPTAAAPGLTTTFTVACTRCATPVTVDRSMKKFRVATDRFEFACPNCHSWMEWAEPKPAV